MRIRDTWVAEPRPLLPAHRVGEPAHDVRSPGESGRARRDGAAVRVQPGELAGGSDSLGQVLLSGQEDRFADHASSLSRPHYLRIIEAGSYPEMQSRTPRRRAAWIDNYVTRLLSRDAGRISTLAHLDRLPQLLSVLAANTSGELVKARVAADVNLPETTLPPYLDLLESFGLIHTLRPWGRNLRQRVIGRPKVALLDTGLACRLAGLTAEAMAITESDASRAGPLLESLVSAELRRQSTWSDQRFDLCHFRQRGGSRSTSSWRPRPARRRNRGQGLQHGRPARLPRPAPTGRHGRSSLHPRGRPAHGQAALRFGPKSWALPVSALWQ